MVMAKKSVKPRETAMAIPYKDQLLNSIIKAYEKAHPNQPFTRQEAAAWAIREGLYNVPMKTQVQILSEELAAAMGAARRTVRGRKVRLYHCIRQEYDDGSQQTLWCHLDIATPEFLENSVSRRRRSYRNQNIQLHNDVVHINEVKGTNIQLLFDYSDDIADYEHTLAQNGDTTDQDDLYDPEE